VSDITGPLAVPVLTQFLSLRQRTNGLTLEADAHDRVVWKWTSFRVYSGSSAYRAMFLGQVAMAGAKEIWKVNAPNEYRFFIWLAF
jgi:hypothetical protein